MTKPRPSTNNPKTPNTTPPNKSKQQQQQPQATNKKTALSATSASQKTSNNKKTTSGKKEEEAELCPICDDVCTCGQVGAAAGDLRRSSHSTSAFKVTVNSNSALPLPTSRPVKTRQSASSAGNNNNHNNNSRSSSFIWDFNVRGQLIPLENLYSDTDNRHEGDIDSDSDGDDADYGSTDAECSDLVSGSDSDDHLSEVVDSGNNSDDDDDSDAFEDEMMVYYQHVPVSMDAPTNTIISDTYTTNTNTGNANMNRISAITPQILAAISKSLCHNNTTYNNNGNSGNNNSSNGNNHQNGQPTQVWLVSDDGTVSDEEHYHEGDGDDDIEMIIVATSSSDGNDAEGDSDNNNSGNSDTDSDTDSTEEEDDRWSRFKRVPVNAFYRRRHHHRPMPMPTTTTAALRPTSVDPQFLVHCQRDSGDDDLAAEVWTVPTGVDEGNGDAHLYHHEPLLYIA